ncbi:cysteine hydrolase [Gordonia sp. zg691]|uniref:Cysteine hydrolase n=1 Tax=Gordonia jinghuaiqii TaxID=2758710 RepID=A0A7D7QUF6_9ACTN|nr:isochorismatase family cysteine hydrolase [Gordonia jinghuaiqii]MBD0862520.1 cysteine hydrolase [Gordonia jinghuaiqii]MCR5976621.1 isochorismatase family protein [Gordonia jinghuaiqii]QMS99808.1 cysteine hydrolase [Gordonia jinghuaiqii]
MGYTVPRIDPATTAVIVVDMENDFVEASSPMASAQAREAIPQMQRVLELARKTGMKVVYSTHAHRPDGSDMGRFEDLYPPIAERASLVDGTPGIEIHPQLKPEPGEVVIKKHRYSAFYGTELDILLRNSGIKTVVIIGTTTENCCHATARDAMFRDYYVVFLADATGTFDYPDVGWGAMSATEVHAATLKILAFSTADVMTVDDLESRVVGG